MEGGGPAGGVAGDSLWWRKNGQLSSPLIVVAVQRRIFGPINQTSDAVGSGHDLEDKALNYYQCMRILGIPHPPILLQVRDSSDEPVASSFLQADGTSRLVVQPLHLPCF